jgi:hydroxymethylbilane synthase
MASLENTLVMGTRGSPLALAQSRQTATALTAAHPGLVIEERIIRTTGDRQQSAPLPAIGGKGVFTLEIEQALLSGKIDFAVHSLKDLPPDLPEGLCLAAIPNRASASDVCIMREPVNLDCSPSIPLPFLLEGARCGTSSLRRSAQLLHLRPDLQIESIRGNIDTRLRKLDEQNFDAIILAQAGLQRLDIASQELMNKSVPLEEREFVPAPGQGALAIEARTGDKQVLGLLSAIEDAPTRAMITAERAAMRHLNAGCSTPLGARATVENGDLKLWAVVLSPEGSQRIYAEGQGSVGEAESIGITVAQKLLESGARDLLKASTS